MMGYRFFLALFLPGIWLGLQAGALFATANEAVLPTSRFEFAIIGDVPYNPQADGYRRPRLVNFTRVENFGSPDVHWVRGIFDPHDPAVFSFKPQLLP
jgi:hypothetical protein